MSQPSSSRRSAAPAVASTSTSSSRRRPGRVQDDESDGEGGAGAANQTQTQTQSQREEEDLDDLLAPLPKPQIDAQFQNSKVGTEAALSKFNTLVREWKVLASKIEKSLETLSNSTSDYVEALSGSGEGVDARDEETALADADYRNLLDKLYEANVRRAALEEQRHKVQVNEQVRDPFDAMEKYVKEKLDEYTDKTARQRYLTNEKYIAFRTAIWEASGEEGGMPALKTFITREDADADSSDEEVELQQGTQNFKDPLTLTWLKNPVRNSKCKHVYSKDVLVDYIKQNTENRQSPSVKCPTAGCSKIIELSDLTEDKQLERRIQQHLRREEERGAQQRGTYQAIDEDDDDDEEEE